MFDFSHRTLAFFAIDKGYRNFWLPSLVIIFIIFSVSVIFVIDWLEVMHETPWNTSFTLSSYLDVIWNRESVGPFASSVLSGRKYVVRLMRSTIALVDHFRRRTCRTKQPARSFRPVPWKPVAAFFMETNRKRVSNFPVDSGPMLVDLVIKGHGWTDPYGLCGPWAEQMEKAGRADNVVSQTYKISRYNQLLGTPRHVITPWNY